MKNKFLKAAVAAVILSATSTSANAGVIDPSSVLLNDAGATMLENWYGQGDLDWNSIWYGTTGASAASWHSTVNGIANTFSIFNITYNGATYLIGGFNSGVWSDYGYYVDGLSNNFIFNLTSNFYHTTANGYWSNHQYTIYSVLDYLPTFGGGHDLFGGSGYIGNGYSHYVGSYNGSWDVSKGNIVDQSKQLVSFRVNALETFTVSAAAPVAPVAPVSAPSTMAIFALGLVGLIARRFAKKS